MRTAFAAFMLSALVASAVLLATGIPPHRSGCTTTNEYRWAEALSSTHWERGAWMVTVTRQMDPSKDPWEICYYY